MGETERRNVNAQTYRILDANVNRAREALRVIEEHARFVCDDAGAALAAKRARHALRRIVETLGVDHLLAARNIERDVGRDLSTAGELRRADPGGVLGAAFARLSEAARALAEYGKLVSPEAARLAEALRYDAYALEPLMRTRANLRRRLRDMRLYVLLTESLCARPWRETAQAVLRGGADCLQLREKSLPDAELLARARVLREMTSRHDALLIVNDRPDIARLAGADGVHLGQDDLPVDEARRIVGSAAVVGVSTHSVAQLDAALEHRPDYVAIGPMFPTPTKPGLPVAGLQLARYAASHAEAPVVAIGGITIDHVAEVVGAGVWRVCVCSAVIGSPTPEEATRTLRQRLQATQAM